LADIEAAHLDRATLAKLADHPERAPRLRLATTSDLIPPWLAARFGEKTGAVLHQLWGPPSGLFVAHHDGSDSPGGAALCLGRPIDNVDLQVLGRLGQGLPSEATGTLLIGPAGVPDSVTGENRRNGPRSLWSSGILARWNGRGCLEFRGDVSRSEELGFDTEEIGVALRRIADLLAFTAMTRRDDGEKVVVVAAIPASGVEFEAEKLRAELAELLRPGRAPDRLIAVESLPRSVEDLPPVTRAAAAALPESRRRLREIWQDVLQVTDLPLDRSFFEVGGHSLLVLQLQLAVEERFGLEIPIALFFQYPTIECFSRFVLENEEDGRDNVPAPKVDRLAQVRKNLRSSRK